MKHYHPFPIYLWNWFFISICEMNCEPFECIYHVLFLIPIVFTAFVVGEVHLLLFLFPKFWPAKFRNRLITIRVLSLLILFVPPWWWIYAIWRVGWILIVLKFKDHSMIQEENNILNRKWRGKWFSRENKTDLFFDMKIGALGFIHLDYLHFCLQYVI